MLVGTAILELAHFGQGKISAHLWMSFGAVYIFALIILAGFLHMISFAFSPVFTVTCLIVLTNLVIA